MLIITARRRWRRRRTEAETDQVRRKASGKAWSLTQSSKPYLKCLRNQQHTFSVQVPSTGKWLSPQKPGPGSHWSSGSKTLSLVPEKLRQLGAQDEDSTTPLPSRSQWKPGPGSLFGPSDSREQWEFCGPR